MEPLSIFITTLCCLALLYLLWMLLFADSDLILALTEKFGRPVSFYSGKVMWLTGASSGLGEAMAYELASVGVKLILSARNTTRLEQVKDKCLEISGGKLNEKDILVLPFDISNVNVQKEKVQDALNHFGEIDVIVNNAGKLQFGRTVETESEVDREIFDVNFFGAVSLTRLVLQRFLQRKKGQIVGITSLGAKMGILGCASYSASKHALFAFYETLRMEHAKDNIHVTVICPGIFESQIMSKAISTKKGEMVKKSIRCPVEMPVSRCAHLTLVAAANYLCEAWISYQPFLFLTWCFQYFPNVTWTVGLSLILKDDLINGALDGEFPKSAPVWKPLFK